MATKTTTDGASTATVESRIPAKTKKSAIEKPEKADAPSSAVRPTVEEFMNNANFDGSSQANLDLIRAFALDGWFIEYLDNPKVKGVWLAQIWNEKENCFSVRRQSKSFEEIIAFAETEFDPDNPVIAERNEKNLNGDGTSDISHSAVVELPLDSISVSEFSPQWHRRRRFKPEELAELAESIKNQGLINPITVRRVNVRVEPYTSDNWNLFYPDRDGGTTVHCSGASKEKVEALARKASHEIVAGERRFEATKLAGLDKILCRVLDLTDEQALEIQLQENLQRVDVNPLDEAFSYQYLINTQRMTVPDLMVKFGKTEKYVTLRLKLNKLIPEVLDLISSEQLPLAHAVEISKFDEAQQSKVLECCFDTSYTPQGYLPDYAKPFPLKSVLQKISSKVLLDLKNAPFPIKDKELRADGLICPKCPERTGADNPMSLFEEYKTDGDDRCLNPSCYQLKTNRFCLYHPRKGDQTSQKRIGLRG